MNCDIIYDFFEKRRPRKQSTLCCQTDTDRRHRCCSANSLEPLEDNKYAPEPSETRDSADNEEEVIEQCQQVIEQAPLSSEEAEDKDALDEIPIYQKYINDEMKLSFSLLKHFKVPEPRKVVKKATEIGLAKKEIHRKILILDLDETMVYSSHLHPRGSSSGSVRLSVKLRPHLFEFLDVVSKKYEIVIYTSGQQKYAESVAKLIDPKGCYFSHILSRKKCFKRKEYYAKDLGVIKCLDLNSVVIIDNSIISFGGHIDNLIYIPSYTGEESDQELQTISEFLMKIVDVSDVRPYVSRFAGIKALYEEYLLYSQILSHNPLRVSD